MSKINVTLDELDWALVVGALATASARDEALAPVMRRLANEVKTPTYWKTTP